MADRYEENALLASVLKNIGNKKVSLYELQGFDHGQVYVPGCCLVANYIRNFIADGRYPDGPVDVFKGEASPSFVV